MLLLRNVNIFRNFFVAKAFFLKIVVICEIIRWTHSLPTLVVALILSAIYLGSMRVFKIIREDTEGILLLIGKVIARPSFLYGQFNKDSSGTIRFCWFPQHWISSKSSNLIILVQKTVSILLYLHLTWCRSVLCLVLAKLSIKFPVDDDDYGNVFACLWGVLINFSPVYDNVVLLFFARVKLWPKTSDDFGAMSVVIVLL